MKLGVIQGVEIYSAPFGEKQGVEIWFYNERVGHTSLSKLRRRGFKIAEILIKEGHQISDAEGFNEELKAVLRTLEEKRR